MACGLLASSLIQSGAYHFGPDPSRRCALFRHGHLLQSAGRRTGRSFGGGGRPSACRWPVQDRGCLRASPSRRPSPPPVIPRRSSIASPCDARTVDPGQTAGCLHPSAQGEACKAADHPTHRDPRTASGAACSPDAAPGPARGDDPAALPAAGDRGDADGLFLRRAERLPDLGKPQPLRLATFSRNKFASRWLQGTCPDTRTMRVFRQLSEVG